MKKVTTDLLEEGQLLHVILDAPKANVIDTEMIRSLVDEWRAAATHPTVKAILLEGRGESFSLGASVAEHRTAEAAAMLGRFHGLLRAIVESAIPTMAAVRGHCLGGGLELASLATWIFAAPGAKLGQPEIKLGVFPPAASVILPWRLGGARALDLCVSGRSLDASEAQQIGLVHAIAEDPTAAARAWFTRELAGKSASSLRFAERAARVGLRRAFDDQLPELERLYLDDLMRTHDATEGIEAFLAKRAPAWRGGRPWR